MIKRIPKNRRDTYNTLSRNFKMQAYVFLLLSMCKCVCSFRIGLTMTDLNSTTWAVVHHGLFMYDVIVQTKHWDPVLLVDGYTGDEYNMSLYGRSYLARGLYNYTHLDTVVEVGMNVPYNFKKLHPAIHLVYFNQGPDYFEAMKDILKERTPSILTNPRRQVDTLWFTPQYTFHSGFLQDILGAAASYMAPYLWDPYIFESKTNRSTRYVRGTAGRVGVYETNRGIYKMSLVPMMAVERVHRTKGVEFARAVTLRNINTTVFHKNIMSRFKAPWQFSRGLVKLPLQWQADRIGTIVSHQLSNDLNYLYLEALYSGMALVHNSPKLRDCGYYYEDANVVEAARAIQRAMTHHDEAPPDGSKCLQRYSLQNAANIEWYERILNKTLPKGHVMFTTLKPGVTGRALRVQNNFVKNFRELDVHTVIFSDDHVHSNAYGTPFLGNMFQQAFEQYPNAKTYTYSNGDILYNKRFVEAADTLFALAKSGELNWRFLGVGTRTNVNWTSEITSQNFSDAFSQGYLATPQSSDYFMVTRQTFDWARDIPPFVIGRPGYDNWLMHFAQTSPDIELVDLTRAVPAIHMTSQLGNHEHAASIKPDQKHNIQHARWTQAFSVGKGQYQTFEGETLSARLRLTPDALQVKPNFTIGIMYNGPHNLESYKKMTKKGYECFLLMRNTGLKNWTTTIDGERFNARYYSPQLGGLTHAIVSSPFYEKIERSSPQLELFKSN